MDKEEIKIPIDLIKIGPRARKDFGNIEELQSSIERVGLINPICINREDNLLIAGERRLRSCKALGWSEIPVKFYDALSEIEQKEIELEENIHKEMTWIERATLRAEIHNLKQELYGKAVKGHASDGWGIEDTARSLGISTGTLSQDMQLIEMSKINPRILNFSRKNQAMKMLTRIKETAVLTELAKRSFEDAEEAPYILVHGECPEALQKITSETVDLILTDPPYAVEINKLAAKRLGSVDGGSYKDPDFKTFKSVLEKSAVEFYRILKPDTHCYVFFGPEFYQQTKEIFQSAGFEVREIPLIWVKEGGGFTDYETKFMPRYEMILFCSKGLRRLNSVTDDVFECNRPLSTERFHTQEKPIALLSTFIKLSSLPNEVILDAFMGSGSTIVAATLLGRRSIGIEKEELIFTNAQERLRGLSLKGGTEDEEDTGECEEA